MFDPDRLLREYLAAKTSGTFGSRVYAGIDLPDGYDVKDGAAVLFSLRGGVQAYHNQLWRCSITMRVYANREADARSAAAEVIEQVNDQREGKLIFMRLEEGTLPVLLREPKTNWPYVLMYVGMFIRE